MLFVCDLVRTRTERFHSLSRKVRALLAFRFPKGRASETSPGASLPWLCAWPWPPSGAVSEPIEGSPARRRMNLGRHPDACFAGGAGEKKKIASTRKTRKRKNSFKVRFQNRHPRVFRTDDRSNRQNVIKRPATIRPASNASRRRARRRADRRGTRGTPAAEPAGTREPPPPRRSVRTRLGVPPRPPPGTRGARRRDVRDSRFATRTVRDGRNIIARRPPRRRSTRRARAAPPAGSAVR